MTGGGAQPDVERLLRRALRPVEPPEGLPERLESTLVSLTAAAAEELETWELRAMRDPRNWVRPAAAAAVGASAGTALVLLRARQRHRRRRGIPATLLEQAERTMRDVADEARKLL